MLIRQRGWDFLITNRERWLEFDPFSLLLSRAGSCCRWGRLCMNVRVDGVFRGKHEGGSAESWGLICWLCDPSVRLDDRSEWSAWRGCVWTSHSMIEPWIPGSVELALFFVVVFPVFLSESPPLIQLSPPLTGTLYSHSTTRWPSYSLTSAASWPKVWNIFLLTCQNEALLVYQWHKHVRVYFSQTLRMEMSIYMWKGFSESKTISYLHWFTAGKMRFCNAAWLAQLPLAIFTEGVYALGWGLRI